MIRQTALMIVLSGALALGVGCDDGESSGGDSDSETETDTTCRENATRCEGALLQRCVDGEWELERDCALDETFCLNFDDGAQCYGTPLDTDTVSDSGMDSSSDSGSVDTASDMVDTASSGADTVTPLPVDRPDVDDDSDSYTNLEGDCQDFEPLINPGAPEIPGDAIDNDCDGLTDEPS